ncbi:MAG: hypothetical protein V7785_12715, partial [Bermanella sp.]
MDILFVSSRGSQYRYYKALSKAVFSSSAVVTLFPGCGIKISNSGLTLDVIRQGLDFHLKRKLRKYKGGSPSSFVWYLYVGF